MLKKKIATLSFSFSIFLSSFSVGAASPAPAAPTVFIDGKQISFEVPPTVVEGTTLVPLRKIFESLGASIEWDATSRTLHAIRKDVTITYTIGEPIAKKNGAEIKLAVPGQIIDGSTLVPLRFVGEALGATVGWEDRSRTITISSVAKQEITVKRVVDGDTLKIDWSGKEESLRLIGVDTPETVHPTKPVQEGGVEASDYSKSSLTGATVFVEVDVQERDQYGRLLGYVYLSDGTQYNAKLVSEGYAKIATFPPNVRWVDLFTYLQKDARDNGRGLWSPASENGGVPQTRQPEPLTTPESPNEVTGHLNITEIDKVKEIVVIRNPSMDDVDLTGWKLTSVEGNQTFTFPVGYTLKSGGIVMIVSGPNAAAGEGVLIWSNKNMWNNEKPDPGILYNAKGEIDFQYEDK